MTATLKKGDSIMRAVQNITNYIYSADRHHEWRKLREAMEDSRLHEIDENMYFLHMCAAYLQLLGGAFIKTQVGLFPEHPMRSFIIFEKHQKLYGIIKERKEYTEEMEQVLKHYNTAYDSSPTSGIETITREFDRMVVENSLSENAQHKLTEHFVSVWQQWISQLSWAIRKNLFKKLEISLAGWVVSFVLFLLYVAISEGSDPSIFGLILVCTISIFGIRFLANLGWLARRFGRSPSLWILSTIMTSPFGEFVAFFKMKDLLEKDQYIGKLADDVWNKQPPSRYFNLGYHLGKQGKHVEAIEQYSKAIELKPDYTDAYNNRGVLYAKLNKIDEAMADYNKAIELKPDYTDIYNNRAELQIAAKKFEDVEQGDALGQFSIGSSYEQGRGVVQDDKEAVKWYRKAAEQEYAPAQYNLGLMYVKGQGIIQDHVYAHMWFNIAAAHGSDAGRENRESIEEKMTPAQIAEAQKLAREWMEKHKQ